MVARSYEKINYSLRPSKHIERRMVADALARLREFGALSAYQYVGFGSTHFVDFSLFHRRLGFGQLVSIEVDEDNRERFEFNNPLGLIDLQFGLSTDVLPRLEWTSRSVVWLDYDGPLDGTTLADVGLVAAVAPSGSVLLVTVNAHQDRGGPDKLDTLKERVGEARVPVGTTTADLVEWGLAGVGRRIVDGAIREALVARSAGSRTTTWQYEQIFNFRYRDGARMNTIGGVIYDSGQGHHLAACGFDEFSFVRRGEDACDIAVPQLTLNEARYLTSMLPLELGTTPLRGVPERDATAFEDIYRYFPTYIDAELV